MSDDKEKYVRVKAVTKWACTKTTDGMTDKYQVDLTKLSEAAVEALREAGIEPREKEGDGWIIKCRATRPIRTVDTDGVAIEDELGNGTEVTAIVFPWTVEKGQAKGKVVPKVARLIVTKLVARDGVGADDGEDAL
ncbi:hypothetical protein UFOVP411_21 [uncultured Caudovirales phage]|uniref:Uncharacterized protein n=1 Tax=uncultured Caudovirales phage TaxID=2100421 RepID=A0A6J5M7E1_9CAUD|nr:hypothetical protein UFOVP411_21 [uncultured Caudovirales phage]